MSQSNAFKPLIHTQTVENLKKEFNTDLKRGLSNEEAKKRLEKYGMNELISGETISPIKMFLLQFKDFIVFLLLGAALVSIIFQDWIEALIIIVIVMLNAIMGFVQEYRAEEA